jgi:hypothetical protein
MLWDLMECTDCCAFTDIIDDLGMLHGNFSGARLTCFLAREGNAQGVLVDGVISDPPQGEGLIDGEGRGSDCRVELAADALGVEVANLRWRRA